MPLSVFIPDPLEPQERTVLRAALNTNVTFTEGPPLPDPADYQILVAGRPTREQLEASPALRALIIPWAGFPPETRTLLTEFPTLSVHNLHHNATATAELTFSLLLAAAKRIVPLDQQLRRGDWRPRYAPSETIALEGKTALILGYGAIGRRVAAMCRGLGMKVLATRRTADQPYSDKEVEIYPDNALHELLPHANALIVTLPLTSETEGLIGEREIALLPNQAMIINIGRGTIVQEEALYSAMMTGRLHSAGLDVWYQYPKSEQSRMATLPATVPLHLLENVVLSPHRGGASIESDAQRMAALAELLNAAARGEEMPNRVKVAQGY